MKPVVFAFNDGIEGWGAVWLHGYIDLDGNREFLSASALVRPTEDFCGGLTVRSCRVVVQDLDSAIRHAPRSLPTYRWERGSYSYLPWNSTGDDIYQRTHWKTLSKPEELNKRLVNLTEAYLEYRKERQCDDMYSFMRVHLAYALVTCGLQHGRRWLQAADQVEGDTLATLEILGRGELLVAARMPWSHEYSHTVVGVPVTAEVLLTEPQVNGNSGNKCVCISVTLFCDRFSEDDDDGCEYLGQCSNCDQDVYSDDTGHGCEECEEMRESRRSVVSDTSPYVSPAMRHREYWYAKPNATWRCG